MAAKQRDFLFMSMNDDDEKMKTNMNLKAATKKREKEFSPIGHFFSPAQCTSLDVFFVLLYQMCKSVCI